MALPLRVENELIGMLVLRAYGERRYDQGHAELLSAVADPFALDRLINYGWPGKVRELENLVERELIRHRGGQLRFDFLLPGERGGETKTISTETDGGTLNLDETMSMHVSKVLKMTKGKIHGPGGAAELLGINPNTLRGRMNKLGIMYGRRNL